MAERTGVLFALRDDPTLVQRAEDLGYESAWAAEGQGRSAFGKLERWATATDHIGLATGIVNIFSRSPGAMAQAAATLDAHSDGRAILGLGVAHPGVIEGFHGMPFEDPLPRMAEYIRLIRRYLRGDAASFSGRFYTPDRTAFWAAFEPVRAEIPIYNGALGPANIRLTGQFANGWLPNLFPTDRLAAGIEALGVGADRADRDPTDIDVAMYVLTAVHDDLEIARDAAAGHIAYYLRDIPGYYDRAAIDAGYEETVSAVRAASTTAAAKAAIAPGLIDELAVVGTPTTVRARLEHLRSVGVDLPIVRAPAGTDAAWVERTLTACAPTG